MVADIINAKKKIKRLSLRGSFFVCAIVFLFSCQFKSNTQEEKPIFNLPYQIEVIAERYKWQIHYPGKDKILGHCQSKFVSETNRIGLDTTSLVALDDFVATDSFRLPVGVTDLHFRATDVLHSAYLPHFRTQMNCVPGMSVKFAIDVPVKALNGLDTANGYYLMCNKICGAGHSKMKMPVKVMTHDEFELWQSSSGPR
jgi:cytochrome c oxidase subunit II